MYNKFWRSLHRFRFYAVNSLRTLLPKAPYRHALGRILNDWQDDPQLRQRLDYYCKLTAPFTLSETAATLREVLKRPQTTYAFDLWNRLKYFPSGMRVEALFGDITHIPDQPSLVKSRPIHHDATNAHSVVMKFNQVRHFFFVNDTIPFADKSSTPVWRGKARNKAQRERFLESYHDHPDLDVGAIDPSLQGHAWHRPYMSITDQLRHRYIMSIEGNEVATNLKWIMSSNSVCLMPRPRFETWFMEGCLQPDVHYVALNDDCSNLFERIDELENSPDFARYIIQQANDYTRQFRDPQRELATEIAVLNRYLRMSGQLG